MKYVLKTAETTIANIIKDTRLQKRLAKAKAGQARAAAKAKAVEEGQAVVTLPAIKGFNSLAENILKKEARAHHIALGFLRGRTMDELERPLRPIDKGHISSNGLTKTPPNWARIEELAIKYGQFYFDNPQALLQSFAEFRDSWTVGEV